MLSAYLSKERRFKGVNDKDLITAAIGDRGRVVFAAPFRRLQRKAQVFALDDDASVRSRLTHSLEVAHTGLRLGQDFATICESRAEPHELKAIPFLVETACMLHDMGNPPFGHFGEDAIRDWFKRKRSVYFKNQADELLAHLIDFDGNAQGFRVATRIGTIFPPHKDPKVRLSGLNLCKAQLQALCKYTRSSAAPPDGTSATSKAGYFAIDDYVGAWVNDVPGRSPLAALMDAADDIANSMSDIEDGLDKQLFTPEQFGHYMHDALQSESEALKLMRKLANLETESHTSPGTTPRPRTEVGKVGFILMKTKLSNHLHDAVLDEARRLLDCEGNFNESLIVKGSPGERILRALKDFSAKHLYRSDEAEYVELGGYAAITYLLDRFSCLLEMEADKFQELARNHTEDTAISKDLRKSCQHESRLLHRFPKKYVRAYFDEVKASDPDAELRLRAQLLVDYVSGMTDDYARKIRDILAGRRLS